MSSGLSATSGHVEARGAISLSNMGARSHRVHRPRDGSPEFCNCRQIYRSPAPKIGGSPLLFISLAVIVCAATSCPRACCTSSTIAANSTSQAQPQGPLAPRAKKISIAITRKLGAHETTTTTPPPAAVSLVVFQDAPSEKFSSHNSSRSAGSANLTSSSSAHQLKRHSYNLTEPLSDSDSQVASETILDPAGSIAKTVVAKNNQTAADPLETSDSFFRPQHRIDSRFDPISTVADDLLHTDEPSGPTVEGDDSESAAATDDDGSQIDGASSNLSEKKVVKELTKILSKGMSGATDQVRVETLENLKRRQRERKALKDNRARMFEEILNTAIQSHPDTLAAGGRLAAKKSPAGRGKSRVRGASSNLRHTSANSADLDPELASDAETVLQHLQGLATAIDSHSPAGSDGQQGDPSAAGQSEASAEGDDSSSSSSSSEASPASDSSESAGGAADERPKRPASERPLVRQFKKIKNQLSQRRKQLDQIKKLFNIELALDPKNGSLIGKPVGGQTAKKKQQVHYQAQQQFAPESDDSLDEAAYEGLASGSSRRSKSPSLGAKADKGRELLAYLRDNPEILASVMAELTVDADPSRSSSGGSAGRTDETESPSPYHHSLAASHDHDEAPFAGSRRRTTRPGRRNQAQQQQAMIDPDDIVWAKQPRSRRTSRERASARYRLELDPRRARPVTARSSFGSQASASSFAAPIKRRTAESLLLESLRERQLLNLARLDLVLAERAAGNRTAPSHQLHTSGSSYDRLALANESTTDHMESYRRSSYDPDQRQLAGRAHEGNSHTSADNHNRQQQQLTRPTGSRVEPSDGELTHHFMMVSPSYSGNDTQGRQLNSNEYLSTFNSDPQIQQGQHRSPPYHSSPYYPPPSQPVGSTFPQPPPGSQNNYSSSGPSASSGAPSQSRPSQQQPPNLPQSQALPPQSHAQSSLRRFRDWRDVSHSELDRASSPPNASVSWYPYDLSTGGGTLASTMEAQSSKSPQFVNYGRGSANGSLSPSHMAALGAGPQVAANQPLASGGSQQMVESSAAAQQLPPGVDNNVNSLFMTRSSAAEPDATTVKLSGADDAASTGKEKSARRHNDLKGTAATPAKGLDDDSGGQVEVDDEGGPAPPAPESVDKFGESSSSGGNSNDRITSAAGGGASTHADYFSSYKDEIATAKRRTRARSSHRREQRRDSQSEPDSDDTGAMWA